ncbi:hypothetical protein [Methylacidimicrobium sp. B4]|uniref:hypothetical protein n=1 Tax=Methylacidimicrobium sp. B4 TaxID=2796139 RepID=UPI001A8DE863|nr:hypothetical protein [Methylacidimicrobium sp. B4]QSR84680.1 hypothetical protein MacB4_10900 [Methylacidimicrobium sp. B4]
MEAIRLGHRDAAKANRFEQDQLRSEDAFLPDPLACFPTEALLFVRRDVPPLGFGQRKACRFATAHHVAQLAEQRKVFHTIDVNEAKIATADRSFSLRALSWINDLAEHLLRHEESVRLEHTQKRQLPDVQQVDEDVRIDDDDSSLAIGGR